jgi:hypothetical protein
LAWDPPSEPFETFNRSYMQKYIWTDYMEIISLNSSCKILDAKHFFFSLNDHTSFVLDAVERKKIFVPVNHRSNLIGTPCIAEHSPTI